MMIGSIDGSFSFISEDREERMQDNKQISEKCYVHKTVDESPDAEGEKAQERQDGVNCHQDHHWLDF